MTPNQIKKDIEIYFNIEDISLKTRKRPYPLMRAVYFNLVHKLIYPYSPKFSLEKIGESCGGFDHATVLHWIKNLQYELKYEPEVEHFYKNYLAENQIRFTGVVVRDVNLRQKNALQFN